MLLKLKVAATLQILTKYVLKTCAVLGMPVLRSNCALFTTVLNDFPISQCLTF